MASEDACCGDPHGCATEDAQSLGPAINRIWRRYVLCWKMLVKLVDRCRCLIFSICWVPYFSLFFADECCWVACLCAVFLRMKNCFFGRTASYTSWRFDHLDSIWEPGRGVFLCVTFCQLKWFFRSRSPPRFAGDDPEPQGAKKWPLLFSSAEKNGQVEDKAALLNNSYQQLWNATGQQFELLQLLDMFSHCATLLFFRNAAGIFLSECYWNTVGLNQKSDHLGFCQQMDPLDFFFKPRRFTHAQLKKISAEVFAEVQYPPAPMPPVHPLPHGVPWMGIRFG